MISPLSSGRATISQGSVFGGILLRFVSGGRSWVSDITLPAIKTQAINEIENLKGIAENAIRNLGGPFPPTSNTCSGVTSRKRSFDLLGAVESLGHDALGLVNCADSILNDISNEIGPITGPPPPQDVIDPISNLLNALEKVGEEEEDNDDQSTTDTDSNTKGSTSTSSFSASSESSDISSSRSSASSVHSSSSQSSSQTSSAVSGCPSIVLPDEDLEEWEGPPLDGNINKRAFDIRGHGYTKTHNPSNQNSRIEGNESLRVELMKREQAAAITSINSCQFPGDQKGAQPGYSGLSSFKGFNKQRNGNKGRNGQVYDAVPKWYVGRYDCSLPNGFTWYKTKDERPAAIPAGSQQSMDHVCKFPFNLLSTSRAKNLLDEKQLVNVFLRTVIDTPDFTCEDMNKVFFDGCSGISLMQTVFNQLPGMQFTEQLDKNPPLYENTNPGFAGLQAAINTVKGIVGPIWIPGQLCVLLTFVQMFDKGVDPPSIFFENGRLKKGIQVQIQTIQDFIMLFGILRDDKFANMFDVTNDRIYKAYQTVDEKITSQNIQKSDGSGPIEANFATTYKTWLTGYLTDIAKPVWSWCSNTIPSLEASLNGKTDDASAAHMKALNQIKASSDFAEDKFTIDWSLSWSIGTLTKRELAERQANTSDSAEAACANTLSATDLSRSSIDPFSTSGSASSSMVYLTSTLTLIPVPASEWTPSTIEPTTLSATPTSAAFSCTSM